jgi:hypothetical protein
MADQIPSQARFIGWLALALIGFALAVALFVAYAAATGG